MDGSLQEIVDEIEAEKALGKVAGYEVFRSRINQPNLLAVRSTDAIQGNSGTGYSEMLFNIPRSILEVETIQLLTANIPQCVPSIPDTACGFWYYRLSEYSGKVPSLNNLYFVRLLPSYYRKEFITNPQLYGFNKTLNSYPQLASQLALACQEDLAYTNFRKQADLFLFFESQFCPRDIEIEYDADINKFRMTGQNAFRAPAYLEWDIATAYAVGDRVWFDAPIGGFDISYECIVANTNKQPNLPINSSFWIADNGPVVDEWVTTLTYGEGRIVVYNEVLYRATATTTNNIPSSSPAFWDDTFDEAEDWIWNRYLITGYDDPNVAIAQNRFFQQYDPYSLFEVDTGVDYEGQFYLAILQTIGNPPTNPTFWTLQSSTITTISSVGGVMTINCDNSSGLFVAGQTIYIVETSNLFFNSINYEDPGLPPSTLTIATASATQLTLTFARVGTSAGGRVSLQLPSRMGLFDFSDTFDMDVPSNFVPIGIPPQPFNPTPKRLLNSILGFTWNGIFNPAVFQSISPNEINVIPTITTDIYNRLRPVPFYFLDPVALSVSLGEIPGVTTQTYTADGYCNLVYSSIVSIYASIVYGASTDSKRNTSLVACGSMNCGNLGVSFFAGYVDNPLLIEGNDIYDLSISLQDEYGEPYVLTNNAVASFTFKLTYKAKG